MAGKIGIRPEAGAYFRLSRQWPQEKPEEAPEADPIRSNSIPLGSIHHLEGDARSEQN